MQLPSSLSPKPSAGMASVFANGNAPLQIDRRQYAHHLQWAPNPEAKESRFAGSPLSLPLDMAATPTLIFHTAETQFVWRNRLWLAQSHVPCTWLAYVDFADPQTPLTELGFCTVGG